MKKRLQKITQILLLVLACCSIITTNAESAASKLTINSYTPKKTAISFPGNFHIKKTSNGKYAYCTDYSKKSPEKITFKRGKLITNNGMNYILNEADANVKNDNDFFVYQTALWIYMVDEKIMYASPAVTKFKAKIKDSDSKTAKEIKSIVSAAKKAGKNDTSAATIKMDTSKTSFKLDSSKKYYVSNKIKVTSSTDKFTVKLTSAPEGTKTEINGKTLVIKVPASKVTKLKTNVKFTVNNSKTTYKAYYYEPSNSKYQVMAAVVKDTKTAKASAALSIDTKASIPAVKIDATTGKVLEGAGLQVTDANGKVVDSWTSTSEEHEITGLTKGTYTLKEISAPKGYILSNETVKFTVNADGSVTNASGSKITKLEYTNQPTSITISKQDITNKQELPGATLVIKDSKGNQIIDWASSDKPYVIKGLAEGTYTLTETNQPEGYLLTTETITFRVDKYGKLYNGNGSEVSSIVMYNTPIKEQDVAISKRDITTNEELKGATLEVKDASGNIIDTWESDVEEHIIKDLKEGTYTLTETIAPEGYIKSTETITFKIDAEGKLYDNDGKNIDKVIIYNAKETPKGGGVSISKQDITNKEELKGATLVIKDFEGNVIDKWISEETPHIIEELKAGVYTLTEENAPDGYVLSTETITFNVKDDGTITKVVMYNSPDTKDVVEKEIPVENTGSFKTITSTAIGLIITLAGSVLLILNIKKKDN